MNSQVIPSSVPTTWVNGYLQAVPENTLDRLIAQQYTLEEISFHSLASFLSVELSTAEAYPGRVAIEVFINGASSYVIPTGKEAADKCIERCFYHWPIWEAAKVIDRLLNKGTPGTGRTLSASIPITHFEEW